MKLRYRGEKIEYPIDFARNSEHVVTCMGAQPAKDKGFDLVRDKYNESFDYSAYTTVYREIEGGVMYSDDGSVYVRPTKEITVSVTWDDEDDAEKLRPRNVGVEVLADGKKKEDIALNAECDWKKTYTDYADVEYSVNAADVTAYEKTISGTTISYKHEVHHVPEPTLEERVDALEEAVSEIAESL